MGMGWRDDARGRGRRVLGVIIRVKYAADIVIIFFRDRMIG